MTALEAESQTSQAFQQSVEDLALEELQRLQLEREQIQAQLNTLDSQMRTVKSVLKAALNGHGKPGQPKGKKKQSPFSMSEERTAEMVSWVTSLSEEQEITTAVVQRAFPGWSNSYCGQALKVMREQGHLRLAATSGQAHVYRRLG